MDNFWKIFMTLFGIGAAISFAKSLKSKKTWREIVSEMIITGFLSVGAGIVYIFFPSVPMIAIVGVASLGAILGVAFLSEKLEGILQASVDKFLGPK